MLLKYQEGGELVAFRIGDAGQAEIECPRFDQLPDARTRHQADVDLAAAAADQLIGEILVDAGIGSGRVEQAVIVQRQRIGARAIGTGSVGRGTSQQGSEKRGHIRTGTHCAIAKESTENTAPYVDATLWTKQYERGAIFAISRPTHCRVVLP